MTDERNLQQESNVFPLEKIYFYLTEGCNLACRHCWLNPKQQTQSKQYPTLDFDLFKSIISQAMLMGLKGVKLTGGEPLMHPRIIDILHFIRDNSIPLEMETNCALCTDEIAKEISTSIRPFVAVSLDGANAETHEWVRGIKGCFDDAVNGIKRLVNAGVKPQIIMSILHYNKNQVEYLIKLAESLGARSLKFNIVQPTGRGKSLTSSFETLSIEEHLNMADWIKNKLAPNTKIKLLYHLPPAFLPLSRIFDSGKARGLILCEVLKIIGVLANGSYAMCGIGSQVPELVFGDANTSSLEDIWAQNSILNELREGIPRRIKGICSKCIFKKRCFGLCMAQNYYSNNELWGSHWFCEEAYKEGRFPSTRYYEKPL